jgi:hypothetical protein
VIHMTTTGQAANGTWDVVCRCTWASHGHATRASARVAGDIHLAKANRPR